MFLTPRMRLCLGFAFAVLAVLALAGCSSIVGQQSTQDITGQNSLNSSKNSAAFIDGKPVTMEDGSIVVPGTTSILTDGTVTLIKQKADGTEAKGSGIPPTTLSVKRADGSMFSLSSPNDTKGAITADATTGAVTQLTFDTSSSASLNAFAAVVREYQTTLRALPPEQRQAYEAQFKAFVDTVDKLSPTLANLVRGLLPVPP